MKHLQTVSSVVLSLSAAVAVGLSAWWLMTHKPSPKGASKPPSAADVKKVTKEEDLNTINLTVEAEKRIGLSVSPARKKSVRRTRVYGGEVMVPAGRSIVVAAPMSGELSSPVSGSLAAGQAVKAGDPIFQLIPLLTPDGRATLSASLAESDGQVNNAKTQVELTSIALNRAKRVHGEGAGSQRQVDEAKAAYDLAVKTHDAAVARQSILKKVIGDADTGTAAPILIEAPETGILRTLAALPGQTVHMGAPLFEVIDISTVWIRVPLPVGDRDIVDPNEPVQVGKLSAPVGTPLEVAKPAAAPPSANALAATVDLFYELPNPDAKLIPGQRLGVTITLADAAESLTVPWSAVVIDVYGGTWVYEQLAPLQYARRRVVIAYTSGSDAVLTSGLRDAAPVVTAGAQELFGAETGFIK